MILDEEIGFELISPQKTLITEDVAFVVVPGSSGDFAVLPRRAPIIARLRPGVLKIYEMKEGKESVKSRIFISGGLVEMNNNHCQVFTENAMPVEEIDRGAISNKLQILRVTLKEAQSHTRKKELQDLIAYNEMILMTIEQDDRLKKRSVA